MLLKKILREPDFYFARYSGIAVLFALAMLTAFLMIFRLWVSASGFGCLRVMCGSACSPSAINHCFYIGLRVETIVFADSYIDGAVSM